MFLAPDERWRLPVSLDDVDPRFVEALVALEDQRFWSHDGVDPIAVVRAAWSDVTHWRRVSGASTLTMQLARLLEPRPRTWTSKVIEMFRAVQLDLRLPKVDGIDVLRHARRHPVWRQVPIIVLTTSRQDSDIGAAYQLGVNSYIVKPVDFVEFSEVARRIEMYWVLTNVPPYLHP